MKILSIVGAQTEYFQAMSVCQELRKQHTEILVYTGEFYDYRIAQDFFIELGLPYPDYNLNIAPGSSGYQTAALQAQIRGLLLAEEPDFVIIYGDTNTALAAVLAAHMLHIPVAHINAGGHTCNQQIADEVNWEIIDRLASLHFCTSQWAVTNLASRGIGERVFWVGDVALDIMQRTVQIARRSSCILDDLELNPRWYILVALQNPLNIYNPQRLRQIIGALNMIQERMIFLAHPRTIKTLEQFEIRLIENIRAIKPVGYFDMLTLEANARMITTDSANIQREAYFLGTPCLSMCSQTDCIETVDVGWNRLVGDDPEMLVENWFKLAPPKERPPVYGDGTAARKIVQIMEQTILRRQ